MKKLFMALLLCIITITAHAADITINHIRENATGDQTVFFTVDDATALSFPIKYHGDMPVIDDANDVLSYWLLRNDKLLNEVEGKGGKDTHDYETIVIQGSDQ